MNVIRHTGKTGDFIVAPTIRRRCAEHLPARRHQPHHRRRQHIGTNNPADAIPPATPDDKPGNGSPDRRPRVAARVGLSRRPRRTPDPVGVVAFSDARDQMARVGP